MGLWDFIKSANKVRGQTYKNSPDLAILNVAGTFANWLTNKGIKGAQAAGPLLGKAALGGIGATAGVVSNVARSLPAVAQGAYYGALGVAGIAESVGRFASTRRGAWITSGAILAGGTALGLAQGSLDYISRAPGVDSNTPFQAPEMYTRAGKSRLSDNLGATGDLVTSLHNLRHGA